MQDLPVYPLPVTLDPSRLGEENLPNHRVDVVLPVRQEPMDSGEMGILVVGRPVELLEEVLEVRAVVINTYMNTNDRNHGFIYLWYDRKRKMFYLGSHLGYPSDRYVCGSKRMYAARRRRPQDFKRRIILKMEVTTIRELHKEEQRWLDMIQDEELGTRYYNMKKLASGGMGKPTPESNELRRISQKKYWSSLTIEQREKRGQLVRGSKNGMTNRKPPNTTPIEIDGTRYASLSEAARILNKSRCWVTNRRDNKPRRI